jgi:peptide/nickel transport system permease protein
LNSTIELRFEKPPANARSGRVDRGRMQGLFRAALRRPGMSLAIAIVATYTLLAIFAPWISTYLLGTTPEAINPRAGLERPSPAHWLGTDEVGRDQVARILHGARVSLGIGFLAAIVNVLLGSLIGGLAGYHGGRVDDVLSWLISTLRAIPSLFLLILIAALFKPSALGIALVIGMTNWMSIARLIRGQVLSLRGREYVTAAKVVGGRDSRILWRHLLPNVFPLLLVVLGADIGSAIIAESGLSYLGFGIQPPTPSWGNMLTGAQRYVINAPWLVAAPGFAIWTTVLSLYVAADAIRDLLDPSLRSTRR